MIRIYISRRFIYKHLSLFVTKYRNYFTFRHEQSNTRKIFPYSIGLCGFFKNWYKSRKEVPLYAEAETSRRKDNFIVDVTRKCAPSVVYIEIKDLKKCVPETGKSSLQNNFLNSTCVSRVYLLNMFFLLSFCDIRISHIFKTRTIFI